MYVLNNWLADLDSYVRSYVATYVYTTTDTELNEVDNHDEDQSNIRSDSTHEELKPVPKPRVGRTPSSNSDGT